MAGRRLSWILAGGLTALVVAGYCVGRHDRAVHEEVATWRRDAEQALQASQASARVAESLRVVETGLRASLARSRGRVDTLRIRAESLLVVHDTPAAVPVLRAALASCQMAIDSASAALEICGRRAALEKARADSLSRILTEGIPLIDCHLLGVRFLPRCPSRVASFGIGTTLGILGTLLLHR